MTIHKKGYVFELSPDLTKSGLTGDQKAIAIMLIIENKRPQDDGYNIKDVEESMRLMRQVLINRLKDPGMYNARGAKTTTDIIRGKGQFHGLESYPKTTSKGFYDAFNLLINSNMPSVKNYVDMAIKIATLDEDRLQPSSKDVVGWRKFKKTEIKPPSKKVKWYKVLSGNHFFILDPDYKEEKPSNKHKSTPHAKKHSSSKKHPAFKVTRKSKK